VLWELHQRGLAGDDARLYHRWFTADPTLPYDDPETWKMANPALAADPPFLHVAGLEDSIKRLHESEFRRLHLAQWTTAEAAWISAEVWDACGAIPMIPDGVDVTIGIDVGLRYDSTAVCVAYRDAGGVYHATWRTWIPARGEEVELAVVNAHVRELCRKYRVLAIAADPYFYAQALQEFRAEGLPAIEFMMSNSMTCAATRTLQEVVQLGRLRHGGDPIARAHALATGVKQTERGLRVSKMESRAGARNDALIALLIAVETSARTPTKRVSHWNDPSAQAASQPASIRPGSRWNTPAALA
jgi:phage terminase large subunit-like protein